MKKLLASFVSAALIFATVETPMFGANEVYAFTIESDAQTAMEKNQENVLAALETMEATNDMTKDQLLSWVMSQCNYSTDEMYGAGVMVENFKLTRATEEKAGSFKADVLIHQDNGEVGFTIRKEIPALGGGKSSDNETASDESVTVDSEKKAINKAFGNMKATNSTTDDDILDAAWDALADGSTITIESSDLIQSTNDKTGSLRIKYTITQANGASGSGEYEWSIAKLASQSPKKDIAAAEKAISDAMFEFEVSNDTTKDDILKMAKNAISSQSTVSVSLSSSDFTIIKASTTVNGTVSATLVLTCDAETKRISVAKTINPVVTEGSTKIDEDRRAIGKALSDIVYSNKVTKESLIKIAEDAVKNGSKIAWKDNFYIKNATFDEDGIVSGDILMSLGEESRELSIREKIPMLVRKMPSDKISLNKEEWEILRLVNVERAKNGNTLLTMVNQLQTACDIREKETVEVFSHTRPDGSKCFSAISGFDYSTAGENIYRCPSISTLIPAKKAMDAWMDSPSHRENILKDGYDYIGIGSYMENRVGSSVQLFAGRTTRISEIKTSTGSTNFADEDAMQKEYLICTTSDGVVSYMPLDIAYMTKNGNSYTLNMNTTNPITLTVGGAKTTNNATANNTQKSSASFTDVKAGAYYENAVKWAVDKKITEGTSSTTFSPDDTCTRAQIITFLWRAVGSPKAASNNPFADVKETDYYYNAAVWASEKGMVTGKIFAADTPCTRASTVTYMWQNAGAPQTKVSDKFGDISPTESCAQAVAWATENGVTSGTSATTFSPQTICSRGQIVTFLNRALAD